MGATALPQSDPTAVCVFPILVWLNLYIFDRFRINVSLIFNLDPRTKIDWRQFIEIPALLLVFLAYCVALCLVNPWPDQISPKVYPAVWTIISAIIVFLPLPVLQPGARWWLIKRFAEIMTLGLLSETGVSFTAFFLTDE